MHTRVVKALWVVLSLSGILFLQPMSVPADDYADEREEKALEHEYEAKKEALEREYEARKKL